MSTTLASDWCDRRRSVVSPREFARLCARVLAPTFFAALIHCTPVNGPRLPLDVRVEADPEVQSELDEVEVVVESLTPEMDSWNLEVARRFNPDRAAHSGWPLRVQLMGLRVATYQVTATARDQAGAIAIQARTIQEPSMEPDRQLRVRLDRECLRRSMVCPRTQTCSFGDCLDARTPLRDRSELPARATEMMDATSADAQGVMATEVCSPEGKRNCDRTDSRQPVACEQGTWRMLEKCSETQRCAMSDPMTRGSCQPLAPECTARKAGDLFCAADGSMHRCGEDEIATTKPCGENEHCVDVAHDVRCSCLPGYIPDLLGCVEASTCKDGGGCDPLTTCSMKDQERTCSDCPAGYEGSGASGCAPLLSGLEVSPGVLEPPFTPNNKQYNLTVPLLAANVQVTARSGTGAILSIANAPASLDTAWSSGVIDAAQNGLPIQLRSSSGVHTNYEIDIKRASAQQTYLKGSNCQAGGWFGGFHALYGDTLVVGAPGESVRGDDGVLVRGAGYAYVFVREGGRWRQQAALKSDAPVADASFGSGVSIWGDRIAVGAPGGVQTVLGTGIRNGFVYMFVRTGDTWKLVQTIESGNTAQTGDAFGFRAIMRDQDMVVGAIYDNEGSSNSGAAYMYRLEGDKWVLQQRLKTTNPVTEGHFGTVLYLEGDNLLVSADHETTDGNLRAGGVYRYKRTDNTWKLVERMKSPTPRSLGQFGYSTGLENNTLVIAEPANPYELSSTHNGQVHVYTRDGENYVHTQTLENVMPVVGDHFGNTISLNTDASWLAVAAVRDQAEGQPRASGTLHLYAHTAQGFQRSAVFHAKTPHAEDHFGDPLIGSDYIAVAAREEDSGACGIDGNGNDESQSDSGAVFVIQ